MTDRAPIPAETFDAAVDRLDRDGLAAFVGRLEAAADGAVAVEVDPPVVTVDDGDNRDRILVAPDGSDADTGRSGAADPPPDVIVVGPDGPTPADADGSVRTTADLRRQLLYAVSPAAAESIAEEWLGTPARSASYAPEPPPTAATGRNADADATAAGSDPDTDTPDGSGVSTVGASTADGAAGRRGGPTPEARGGPEPPDERSGAAVTRRGGGVAVVAVLVVVILAVAGGVVYAAEVSTDGDAGAFAAPGPVDTEGLSDAEIRRGSRDLIDESGAVATATPTPETGPGSDGRPRADDTEANRNVRPAPTCERSFLHVVQIQVNALKYNNDTTDDGIRTVRRFASPRNRQAIQTFDEFVRVIQNPTYSPMLSHDSAQYTPIQSSDDYAQVYVTTREDGNVTGQYTFRLRKIDAGEYEGCWMTDAVVSVPETGTFSAEVTGRSTGSPNGT